MGMPNLRVYFASGVIHSLSFELENDWLEEATKQQQIRSLCEQLIILAETCTSGSEIRSIWFDRQKSLDTLQLEHDQLIVNIQWVNQHILTIRQYFSSFQHVDQFKQTTHILNTFNANNSNLSDMHRTQGKMNFTSFNILKDHPIFAGHFPARPCFVPLAQFSSRNFLMLAKLIKQQRTSVSRSLWTKRRIIKFEIWLQWFSYQKNFTKTTSLKPPFWGLQFLE